MIDTQSYRSADYEFGDINNLFASGKTARQDFIRKVFLIFLTQIGFTFIMVLFAIYKPAYRQFYAEHFFVNILAIIVLIATSITLYCTYLARKVPHNYLLLALFTFCEGYLLSYVGFYRKDVILTAAILTLAVTIGLTTYAFTTDSDLTMHGGLLFIVGSIFTGLVLIGLFVQSTIMTAIVAALGCFVFGFYIIYDVQLILGTKAEKFSLDDYIVAALSLYVDVIGLFIQILELVSLVFGNDNNS